MPLTLPSEVVTMLNSGSVEVHSTLDITFGDASEVHLSTVAIDNVLTTQFGTIDYEENLRTTGSLNQTLTVQVDRVDLTVQNVDLVLGGSVISTPASLNGANGIFSMVFIDGATKKQVVLLEGEISNASSEDLDVKFQLVSYLSLSGPLGGWRPLMRHCAWRFKRPGCDSTDASTTCSHLFDDPNGCSSKAPAARLINPVPTNNQGSFGGFIFKSTVIVGSVVTDPAGAVDAGNDFNTYLRNRGEWAGRHILPAEYYQP